MALDTIPDCHVCGFSYVAHNSPRFGACAHYTYPPKPSGHDREVINERRRLLVEFTKAALMGGQDGNDAANYAQTALVNLEVDLGLE